MMGLKSRGNVTSSRASVNAQLKQKVQVLEDDNQKLRDKVDRLVKVNGDQINRLNQMELVQIRIRELETKLASLQPTSNIEE